MTKNAEPQKVCPLGQSLIAKYPEIAKMHRDVYSLLQQIDRAIKTTSTQEDRVDLSVLLKEYNKIFKDLEKETRLTKEKSDTIAAAIYTRQSELEDNMPKSIRGHIGLGTPDIKMEANIPSKTREPERFMELMTTLGVSEELAATGAVTAHYKGIQSLINARLLEGKNPPKGIDPNTVRPRYTMTVRFNKGFELNQGDEF